ncbi:unnamed protein product [Protopolystoma xenopodis]|uniref:Uncharacterized protein n=1 Tax=Protopolystoma xenopodis TaxID=117903 RepID=A0A3S5CVX7_9PLAT|nr:unnamed protein product [Protopolystoma xenopodis]
MQYQFTRFQSYTLLTRATCACVCVYVCTGVMGREAEMWVCFIACREWGMCEQDTADWTSERVSRAAMRLTMDDRKAQSEKHFCVAPDANKQLLRARPAS